MNILGVQRKGVHANAWKGGRVMKNGYIRVYAPHHPNAIGNYVLEHRLIMSKALGRPLTEGELVHHLNDDKTDNRLENLEIISRKEHASYHDHRREYNMVWSVHEDTLLRKLWSANVSKPYICCRFVRTWNAIKIRARKLGLRRHPSHCGTSGMKFPNRRKQP